MNKSNKKNSGRNNDPESAEQATDTPDMGAYLRQLREAKGLSILDISQVTRISTTNLEAIENRDYAALPADTFARGFLTIYGKFLGVDDPGQVTADFMQERDESLGHGKQTRLRQPRHAQTTKKLAEPNHLSSITMAGILFLIILAILIGLSLFTSWKPFGFLEEESSALPKVMMDSVPASEQKGKVMMDSVPASEQKGILSSDNFTAAENISPADEQNTTTTDPLFTPPDQDD